VESAGSRARDSSHSAAEDGSSNRGFSMALRSGPASLRYPCPLPGRRADDSKTADAARSGQPVRPPACGVTHAQRTTAEPWNFATTSASRCGESTSHHRHQRLRPAQPRGVTVASTEASLAFPTHLTPRAAARAPVQGCMPYECACRLLVHRSPRNYSARPVAARASVWDSCVSQK
jgi:hypothetical protein